MVQTQDRDVLLTCYSMWEGHVCHQPLLHRGLHRCAFDECPSVTWNTDQATAWLVQISKYNDDVPFADAVKEGHGDVQPGDDVPGPIPPVQWEGPAA